MRNYKEEFEKRVQKDKEYQRENGLTVDGNAGPNTLNSLVGKAKKLQQETVELSDM